MKTLIKLRWHFYALVLVPTFFFQVFVITTIKLEGSYEKQIKNKIIGDITNHCATNSCYFV